MFSSLFFNKVTDLRPATLIKRHSNSGVFLRILRNFKEKTSEKHLETIASLNFQFSENKASLQRRKLLIKLFLANVPILCPLKTPENHYKKFRLDQNCPDINQMGIADISQVYLLCF